MFVKTGLYSALLVLGFSAASQATAIGLKLNNGSEQTFNNITISIENGVVNITTDPSSLAIDNGGLQGVNRPPVAAADNQSTGVGGASITIDVLANDTDADNDALTLTGVGTTSANGTAVISGQQIQYTPPSSTYEGEDRFTYTVSDGQLSSQGEVTVRVGNVNQPPTAVADSYTLDQDTNGLIDVLSNDTDPENDSLTLSSVSTPSSGTAVLENGQVRYTPNNGFHGQDSFNYTVRDSENNEASGLVSVTVNETQQTGNCPAKPSNVDIADGINWGQSNPQVRLDLEKDGISAVPFTTNNSASAYGAISFASVGNNDNVTKRIWISECPGGEPLSAGACKSSGSSTGRLNWYMGSHYLYCTLPKNKQLYFNVEGVNCGSSGCYVLRNYSYDD